MGKRSALKYLDREVGIDYLSEACRSLAHDMRFAQLLLRYLSRQPHDIFRQA